MRLAVRMAEGRLARNQASKEDEGATEQTASARSSGGRR